jgi:hypothetical protein
MLTPSELGKKRAGLCLTKLGIFDDSGFDNPKSFKIADTRSDAHAAGCRMESNAGTGGTARKAEANFAVAEEKDLSCSRVDSSAPTCAVGFKDDVTSFVPVGNASSTLS